jgi:hypothetical protein
MQPPLTNLQVELLKLYALNLGEQQLLDIRNLVGQYLAKQAIESANQAWDEKGYTNESMKEWVSADNT